jgi:hypothetical protein
MPRNSKGNRYLGALWRYKTVEELDGDGPRPGLLKSAYG